MEMADNKVEMYFVTEIEIEICKIRGSDEARHSQISFIKGR